MGCTEHTTGITRAELVLRLNQDDVEDVSFMKVKAIVTEAKSYDILLGSAVLPMGFTLDFWEETASYNQDGKHETGGRLSCQLDLFEFSLETLLMFLLFVDV